MADFNENLNPADTLVVDPNQFPDAAPQKDAGNAALDAATAAELARRSQAQQIANQSANDTMSGRPVTAPPAAPQVNGLYSRPPATTTESDLVTKQSTIPDELKDQINAGVQQEMAGVAKQKEAAQTMGQAADTYNTLSKNISDINAKTSAFETEAAAETKTRMKRVDDLTNDMLANSDIDPNRLFANMGTGSKIMAGIGLALGALGQAVGGPGGKNLALDVIEKSIDRDIEAQKASFLNKTRIVEAARTGFAQYMNVLGDKRAATIAEANRQLQYTSAVIDGMKAKAGSQEQLAKIDQLQGQIKSSMTLKQAELEKTITDQTIKTKTAEAVKPDIEVAKFNSERSVPGFEGAGPNGTLLGTTGAIDKFRESVATTKEAANAIKDLRDLLKIPKVERDLMPDIRTRAENTATSLQLALRTALEGGGQLTRVKKELLEKLVRDPSRIFSIDSATNAAIDTLENTLNKTLATKAQILGARPIGQVDSFKPGLK